MAKKQPFGTFKDFGKSLTGPSLGPLPTPTDDTVDLDPTWRGFVVVQGGNVTFTGENGHTETRAFPTGFTMEMMITRITLATTDAEILGLE